MSGIVRKVDELGRIVIPKELRNNLNIKNSDDLEISIENNKIILEKFYRLRNLSEIMKIYYSLFERFLTSSFIITDKESVILVGKTDREIKDRKLVYSFIDLINSRRQISNKNSIKITNDFKVDSYSYFCPIIVNTDVLGSIMLYSDKSIDEKDKLITEIVLFLLKEQLS